MYYRLLIKANDGTDFGYQWKEIDLELFTSIGTGANPEADAQAQTRDSTDAQCHVPEYRTLYYTAVWNQDINDWTNSITDPATDYEAWGQLKAGA